MKQMEKSTRWAPGENWKDLPRIASKTNDSAMGNSSSKSHEESTEHSILTAMRDDEQGGNVNANRK